MKESDIIIQDLQKRIALYEDISAYRQLYDLLYNSLYRFSFAFVKSKEAAEEIVSDVFVKLWQIRGRLTEIENLRVYLYTISKNFSLNYITKYYKNPVVSLDEIDIEAIVEVKSLEDIFISADLAARIRETIQCLPPQCRIIFQLVKEEGLKYKEVASILNISSLTVRNQVAISVKKIGETLPAYLLPEPASRKA
ncbi:MAG: RNA polymerase sigma-70 factor [Flavitalea sp.]